MAKMAHATIRFRHSLVAANVYVTASGRKSHAAVLISLLSEAQRHCVHLARDSTLRTTPTMQLHSLSTAAVAHAYADPVYNRSSFHFAGTAGNVVQLVSHLVDQAVTKLSTEEGTNASEEFSHPTVGLVDHIAVMPLDGLDNAENSLSFENDKAYEPKTASGWAARRIGESMNKSAKFDVFYYGSADPHGSPLATVRRERTSFFRSGGISKGLSDASQSIQNQVATIGAPLHFVENYNIRLLCSKNTAQSLTRHVRERDGGLVGVEALTLPYSHGRWEVACNLLRPDLTTAADVHCAATKWELQQQQLLGNRDKLIEEAYRVGTTADQCRHVLSQTADDERRASHDAQVKLRLSEYLSATL